MSAHRCGLLPARLVDRSKDRLCVHAIMEYSGNMPEYIAPNPADPAYDFLRGKPQEIVTAYASPRLLVVGAHGTEHLAARVAHHIVTERPDLLPHVDYMCGTPQAAAATPQLRYTGEHEEDPQKRGSDFNRSFGLQRPPRTPEELRAAVWLGPMREYAHVLDVHTTTTSAGPEGKHFLVARPRLPEVREIVGASSIRRVVVMPWDIARPSLIGQVERAASIEYNQHVAARPESVREIIAIIDNLIAGRRHEEGPLDRKFYEVERAVPVHEDPGEVDNFVWHEAGGYYPIMFGENSYRKDPTKQYLGFAAARSEIVRI